MRDTLVITDVTRMWGGRVCVAGIDSSGVCVRPVVPGQLRESDLWKGDQLLIRPRAKIEFDLEPSPVTAPHIEDRRTYTNTTTYRGTCTDQEWEAALRRSCFPSVAVLFDGHLQEGRYVLPGAATRSIGTVEATQIDVVLAEEDASRSYRLDFTDQDGTRYTHFPINDLTFGAGVDRLVEVFGGVDQTAVAMTRSFRSSRVVYLRIGLARPWDVEGYPEACWTQVTAVHTFPDYLSGRTLADFNQREAVVTGVEDD
jgi:hypothetical protein